MIENYICPDCKQVLTPESDDANMTHYKCVTHGYVLNPKQPINENLITDPFSEPLTQDNNVPVEQLPADWLRKDFEDLKKRDADLKNLSESEDIEDLFLTQIHQTVSAYDDHIIKIGFHVALSVYNNPLNLALKCESGSGKTYSTLETLKFMPPENVFQIGSQSPKVFTHENGVKKDSEGKIIDEKDIPVRPIEKACMPGMYQTELEKYQTEKQIWDLRNKNAIYEVDLRGKIICFLESVNIETFKMLKTTMSHDSPYIDHKYVDDKGNVHVTRLVGAPVMIFNSLDTEYISEFATRCLTATPNTRKEKIADALRISNNKSCYPWQYSNDVYHKQLIREYIRKIRDAIIKGKLEVINPFDGIDEAFSKDAVRDMRDFNKFLELLPSYALFKLYQRPIITIQKHRYIIPTIQDVLDAKNAYDAILETTKTGSDYRVLEFYYKIVVANSGSSAEVLTDIYNSTRKNSRKTTVKTVRNWLLRLEDLGWVDIRAGKNEAGYTDNRLNNYFALKTEIRPIMAESNSDVLLKSVCEKSFEKWLNNMSSFSDSPLNFIQLNIDGTAKRLTETDVKERVLKISTNTLPKSGHISNVDLSLNSEKKAEITAESETGVIGRISAFPVMLYRKLTPSDVPHKCDICEGLLAEYQQDSKFYCENCFNVGKTNASVEGYTLKEIGEQ